MTERTQKIRRCLWLGAIHGSIAWTVYWLVECWYASVLPRILAEDSVFATSHWRVTAVLLGSYVSIGFTVGLLFGASLAMLSSRNSPGDRLAPSSILPALATLTVVLALAVHLVVTFARRPVAWLTLAFCLFFGGAIVLKSFLKDRPWRLGFLTNPWTVCLVLAGLPWITQDLLLRRPQITSAIAAIGFSVALFLIAGAFQAVAARQPFRRVSLALASPVRSLLYLAALAGVALGFLAFADRPHRQRISFGRATAQDSPHPNIVLITMDAVRADHLPMYGYHRNTAPNLAALCQDATLYTRAIAASDMTLPSHASIFTGRYPSWHGAHFDIQSGYPHGRPLSDEFQTLAETLLHQGYQTIGVVANHAYLGRTYGFSQGFRYYSTPAVILLFTRHRDFYIRRSLVNILAGVTSTSEFHLAYRRAEAVNAEVFPILEVLSPLSRPFFLFVNYMDCHFPYVPPHPFDSIYPGKDTGTTFDRLVSLIEDVGRLRRGIRSEEQRHLLSQYDGGIAYMDLHFGRLLARLKELGLYENSLIIVTSDHGEALGEKSLIGHARSSVYQDQLHVPLVVKYPGREIEAVIEELVSHIDLMPTIMKIVGGQSPPGVQGQSMIGLGLGQSRNVLSEAFPSGHFAQLHPRFDHLRRALFSGQWKLIVSSGGKKELYDLVNDPKERENRYQPNRSPWRELAASLDRILETLDKESRPPAKPDPKVLDRLRSLGYLQ